MEENKIQTSKSNSDIIDRVWHFFSSIKLAFILIIVIALLSLSGALIMQYTGAPDSYQTWLENVAQSKFGLWTPIMALLQLFRIFHSIWFLGAGTLLVINILVCSLARLKSITQVIRGGHIVQTESYYQSGGSGVEVSLKSDSAEAVSNLMKEKLQTRGYRVRVEKAGDNFHFAADKNRYSRLGTYLTHFSLILFILGFLVSAVLGYRNEAFTVGVGGVENVGDNSRLSLKLLSFTDEYYPDGSPKDFRSEVVLYDSGQEVKQATIRVNHPLSYKNYKFFQSSFGPTVLVLIKDSSGQTIVNGDIQMNYPVQLEGLNLMSGGLLLPQSSYELWAYKANQGGGGSMINEGELVIQIIEQSTQKIINMGKVVQGTPTVLNDLEINYLGDSQYSGFQVTRDPGANFIWAASIFLLAGLVLVFYFPVRQLWAVVIPAGAQGSRVLLRTNTSRASSTVNDLNRLVKEIEYHDLKNKKNS